MKIQVGKWGNSLAVRIPLQMARDAGIKEGTLLDAELVESGLLMKREPSPTIEELMATVTPDMLHGETEWGPARGKEAW